MPSSVMHFLFWFGICLFGKTIHVIFRSNNNSIGSWHTHTHIYTAYTYKIPNHFHRLKLFFFSRFNSILKKVSFLLRITHYSSIQFTHRHHLLFVPSFSFVPESRYCCFILRFNADQGKYTHIHSFHCLFYTKWDMLERQKGSTYTTNFSYLFIIVYVSS